ncbi:M16 family metallopeptidase [Sphingomonas kyeonggiensis]|uniref:Putative Zn-dependent peptidase n=1 Tax=Sphingomonas kyeonggiensis TaxID=1268553 RepID=A0A7W6JV96_9SPHN|nr:pitrilysin family protein [Sphingomonas kyeonggiensis]MBB4100135.1 putative Zn-dependent peptidase [Sphingomonas kyeonggiensis]
MKSLKMFCSASISALAIGAAMPAIAQQAPATAAAPARAKPVAVSELVKKVDIPYEAFTLKNGLRVLVHTDRKAPIVAVSTWYDVGSKHEPAGKTGFAHLFEHLMFNGSENAPGDFFEPLKQVGATDFNGTTSFDRTNYFETVPRPALDRALFLESDRMGYLLGAITQGVLDEQRGVVQNEKRQGDNQPYGLVYYSILENLLGSTPYGHNVIGSMADLDAASLDDVKNWFRSHYGPNNAILVLAGDIDAKEARPLVEKYFGAIPAGPKSVLPKVTVPTLAAPKTVTLKDSVAATLIVRSWAVPGMNDTDATPLNVFASVLGGLASSRLDNELVRKQKTAVRASADVDSMAQIGIFSIQVVVKPGVDPALVEKQIDGVVADLLKNGPTADEVARVATTNVSGRISGLESVGGFGGKAVALAEGQLYSNDPLFFKKQLEAMAKVTPAQAVAAANKWLGRPALTVMVVPGQREAYQEATAVAAKPAEGPAAEPAKGTRGALPDVAPIGDLVFPKVERTKLSNGIELVYANRNAVPVTQLSMSFDAGVAADPSEKLGTQRLTLNMMDEGTTTLDSVAFSEARERLGANIGSGSSADRTYLSVDAPSPNLAGALDLFADVVERPAFAPAELERVRGQMLTGIAQELTSPQGMSNRMVPRVLYPAGSPYAKLAAGGGDPAVVKAITRDDLVAWHKAWIRPDKAKIFVVSDRPLAEIKAALEARFGGWKAEGAAGTKSFAATTQAMTPRIILIDRPNSPQSQIIATQLTGVDPFSDTLPVATANQALGSGFLSRINMDLREAKHWSYGAGGGFSFLEHAVPYTISAPVQADKTGDSIKAIQQQVKDFLTTKGVTNDELVREVNGSTRELPGRFETSDAVLSGMQQNDLRRRPDDYFTTIAQKYRALTIPQLDAAARAALDPNKFVYVVVGDASKVRPQLDSIGLPVEVVPAASLASTKPAGN